MLCSRYRIRCLQLVIQQGFASDPSARVTVMTTMLQGGDFAAVPELGYEEWRAVVRSIVGRYNPESIDPNAFAGRVQERNLFGLGADRFDHNAPRIERTQRDVRLDDMEFYHAVFLVVGRSTVLQSAAPVTDVASRLGTTRRVWRPPRNARRTPSLPTCSGRVRERVSLNSSKRLYAVGSLRSHRRNIYAV
jgi:hypothetical protein